MLFLEKYTPKPKELIYHYCSSESFQAICENKTMRLSDLFTMNDSVELKWGYSIWIEVANILIKELGHEFIDSIDKQIHEFGFHSLIISSSFSLKNDMLSQWRAYSSDGNGYCLGFNAQDIFELPVYPFKIIYNKKQQIKKVTETVRFIHFAETVGKEKFGQKFFDHCFFLSAELASMKNPTFFEEKEIRVIHILAFKPSNKGLKLTDDEGQKVKFRFREDCPIAYLDYDFTKDGKINPIKEVIIGPKNKSLTSSISIYLETLGIENVIVKNSKIPYV